MVFTIYLKQYYKTEVPLVDRVYFRKVAIPNTLLAFLRLQMLFLSET